MIGITESSTSDELREAVEKYFERAQSCVLCGATVAWSYTRFLNVIRHLEWHDTQTWEVMK